MEPGAKKKLSDTDKELVAVLMADQAQVAAQKVADQVEEAAQKVATRVEAAAALVASRAEVARELVADQAEQAREVLENTSDATRSNMVNTLTPKKNITPSTLEAIGETVREAVDEVIEGNERRYVEPGVTPQVARSIAEHVFEERIPGHVLACPLGGKLDKTNTRVLLATGAVLLVAALIPLFGVLLNANLNSRATQLDAMRTQLVTVQLQMARMAAIQEAQK